MNKFRRFYKLLALLLVSFVLTVPALAMDVSTQAERLFYQGQFEQALLLWQQQCSAEQASQPDAPPQCVPQLIKMAMAYRHLGAYGSASDLLTALQDHLPSLPVNQQAEVLNELSKLTISSDANDLAKAAALADQAYKVAKQVKEPQLLAEVLNQQGNLLSIALQYEKAKKIYQRALAMLSSDDELHKKIEVNQLRLKVAEDVENAWQYSDESLFADSTAWLTRLIQQWQPWQDKFSEILALISLSEQIQKLQDHLDSPNAALKQLAYQALHKAVSIAEELKQARALSYAYGHLGALYEHSKQYKSALYLTRQAVFAAQQIQEKKLLYQWQWQSGRIFWVLNDYPQAIEAYQQAVANFNPIQRQVATTGYCHLSQSFRERIAPIYFELADLLLKYATVLKTEGLSNDKQRNYHQHLLSQARDAIEQFKTVELQNYYQDDCIAMQTKCNAIDEYLDEHTAILYPIPLTDRLELLLTLKDEIVQATVPVTNSRLREEVALFLLPLRQNPTPMGRAYTTQRTDNSVCSPALRGNPQAVRTTPTDSERYFKSAEQLHQWLIEPLSSYLQTGKIQTLVIVAEGVLRTLPFAALYDGQQYLIEKYALSVSPRLCLQQPSMTHKPLSEFNILLAGLSEEVQGFSALPCAAYEINSLDKLYQPDHNPLLDKDFTLSRLDQEIRHQQYDIVHLASHGQFKANLDNTFILTYDGRISLNHLEELMTLSTIQNSPVELLTLSACETAVGDDQAALGLAGVALKAGVKTALASLWQVDDEATPAVVIEFYRHLREGKYNKAQALQEAQRLMIRNPTYQAYKHPYFWAAFLMIGHWL